MKRELPHAATQREAQLEAILSSAVDAIITIDVHGIVESVNPATERMFGYQADEIIGRNVKLLMPSPYSDEHDSYIHNYVHTREPKIIGVGREVTGRRKDGTTFPMHLAVSELQLDHRRLFTGIVRDISDLKQAERQLAELNEQLELRVRQRTEELKQAQAELVKREKLAMLGQVSGGIAHEIRNPLNALKTSTYYLMNAKSLSPEKMQEHLERIDRQVVLIDNVITALSDVARLPDAQLHPMSIGDCVKQVVETIEFPDNVKVVQALEDSLPQVMADENQIAIAFGNLLRNARDSMPNGGRITISATPVEARLAVSIRDEGVGIAAEDVERVTEALYSTKARGMGLGLAVTRAILDKNQGLLEINSELDAGSDFVVKLLMANTK